MLSIIGSYGIWGLQAYPIQIEVEVSRGLPAVIIVGLADMMIKESKERVKSAIKNSGFNWPGGRITVNLAPSDTKKAGSCYDLPIALGILAATEQINPSHLNNYSFLGELSLEGIIRPIQGALSVSMAAAESPIKNMVLPYENAKEAAIITGVNVYPLRTLKAVVEFLNNPQSKMPFKVDNLDLFSKSAPYGIDFSDVKGQYLAKRALEVAVAGRHNVLMIGSPGSGKSMLAKRLPTIMPDLSLKEALEITCIHSAAGILYSEDGIVKKRPFRNLHHTISDVALAGGGTIPKPGEISLAHYGVLFLDELPEFRRNCLETLRQPLEDGFIRISRINKSLVYPSSFMLVCAMNPCPCGYYTNPEKPCRCSPNKVESYKRKISGPLLDRIDIHISMPPIRYKELTDKTQGESSAEIKKRVEEARSTQLERFKDAGIFYNGQMDTSLVKKYCLLDDTSQDIIRMAMTEMKLSARAYDKILKVSRTIADLAGEETIKPEHVLEAVQYRDLDRSW